jgi:transcriptional regulator with XRE-family HTH domain
MSEFTDWLQGELNQRSWDAAKLAQSSGITAAQLSKILLGMQKPGIKTCTLIAKAFNIPDVVVLRKANILQSDPKSKVDELDIKILYLLKDMPRELKEEVLEYIKMQKVFHSRR